MFDTFDNDNAMLLAAVQELTSELATAQSKIAELEKGGGGGEIYLEYTGENLETGLRTYTIQNRAPNLNDIIKDLSEPDFRTLTTAINNIGIYAEPETLPVDLILYDGSLIQGVQAQFVYSIQEFLEIYRYNNNLYLKKDEF